MGKDERDLALALFINGLFLGGRFESKSVAKFTFVTEKEKKEDISVRASASTQRNKFVSGKLEAALAGFTQSPETSGPAGNLTVQ